MQEQINVTAIVVGGSSSSAKVQKGSTIGDALRAQGIQTSGFSIRAGGREVTENDLLQGDTKIVLAKRIEGNNQEQVKVTAIVVGGASSSATVAKGSTIGDALRAQGIQSSGFSIRAGGREVTENDVLQGDTKIVLAKRIEGNGSALQKLILRGQIWFAEQRINFLR